MKKRKLSFFLALLILTSCGQNKEKIFEKASQEVNKQCPVNVDEVTRMDSTSYAASTNTFAYYYTLTGEADNPDNAPEMKAVLEKKLPESIKSTNELKMYRDNDVTMLYVYFSAKDKQELFRVKVGSDLYK